MSRAEFEQGKTYITRGTGAYGDLYISRACADCAADLEACGGELLGETAPHQCEFCGELPESLKRDGAR
jgi:hypothetical protein